MNVKGYLRSVAPEALILCIAASSLAYLFCTGFIAFEGVERVPVLVTVTCVVFTAALYAVAYSKRTALIGGIALGLVCIVAFAAVLLLAGAANVLADTEGNVVLLVVVAVLTALAAFLLSRKRALCVLLVVGGVFAYGVIQYLFLEGHVVAFVVFVVSGTALIMYRTYRLGLRGSETRKAAFLPVLLFTSLSALVIAGIAVGVFYLVIEPLGPEALEIKLITEVRALEELPRRGVNDELAITDPDMTSAVTNGELVSADEDDEDDKEKETDPDGTTVSSALTSAMQTIGSSIGYANDSVNNLLDLITFERVWWGWVLLALLILALLAAPVLLKRHLRKRFYERARALPPAECVEKLYLRIMRDFKRMGVERGPQATPFEFAYDTQHTLRQFSENELHASFMHVTVAFVAASFGGHDPTPAQMASCYSFYDSFYKNCRAYVGTLRYVWLYFRL